MALNSGSVDRVLVNANVLTMDVGMAVASAIAISSDRIVAVGSDSEIRALTGPGTAVEDLRGATVLPGLIDAHNHLLMTGQILQQLQLYDCRSIDDILSLVKAAVDHTPPGQWILGRGWDE